MNHVVIRRTGGPEVLEWEASEPEPLQPGHLRVRLAAAGLNFIDTYHRTGLYPVELPFVPGLEGSGTVESVGTGVDGFHAGDRVVWSRAGGSYAEIVDVPAAAAVAVEDGVDLEAAAAVMLQGMTAQYLAADTYPLRPGDRCLIHAGAGGVGLLLTQIAKMHGAEVFTTVGTDEKATVSRAAGADHVINYNEADFAEEITDIAGPTPLHVVYDGVGKSVFWPSLDLLRPRGMMVTFGNASGPVDPVSPLDLMRRGSLFLTRPTLFTYTATREELVARAGQVLGWVGSGQLDVRIGLTVPLRSASDAHRLLESRATTGKVLLIP